MTDSRDLADFVPPVAKGPVERPARGWLAFHAACWAFVAAVLLLVVPRFATVFADFGLEPSWVTAAVFRLARLRLVVAGAVAALLVADGFVLAAPARRAGARAWLVMMVVLPALLLAAVVVALALPLATITTRLSG